MRTRREWLENTAWTAAIRKRMAERDYGRRSIVYWNPRIGATVAEYVESMREDDLRRVAGIGAA